MQKKGSMTMKRIDLETHFYTQDYVDAMYANSGKTPCFKDDPTTGLRKLWYNPSIGQPFVDVLLDKLLDLGAKRLEKMDQCEIDIAVLSLSAPGIEQFDPQVGTELAYQSNNALSEVIKQYPDRFMGYAALAPKNPEEAVKELERAVRELGFKGWNTHSNYGETMLDDPTYIPVLEKAAELNVPIYIHPTVSAFSEMQGYGFALAGAPFGFGIDAALCMLRVIYSGIFDTCPNLKVILGHLGEALPFLFSRIDWAYVRPFDPESRPKLKKKPSEYLKNNVYITTSGNYYQPAFKCAYDTVGSERILLGTDYPYEDMEECIGFIDGLPMTQEDKDKIYCLNAKSLGF
jgi:uncharacterized protein